MWDSLFFKKVQIKIGFNQKDHYEHWPNYIIRILNTILIDTLSEYSVDHNSR